ncbi:YeiH family protein [Undibacterium sp.]|uniref:YeiH family protein n=1 Tax=Undibacterium sp. TaxID=1914977 RepID=UPI0025CE9A26|nr:YeiH family protein [Undibacterium sp.]
MSSLTAKFPVLSAANLLVAGPASWLSKVAPGALLSAAIAWFSSALGQVAYFQQHALSTLTIAILLGMFFGNTVFPRIATPCAAGVAFSKQTLLRLAVVLYGLRLTFQDVAQVGVAGVLIDALMLSSTFGLALLLGIKLLKLDRETVILIGAGSSICGAAAVMATEPVLQAKSEKITVAVATVVVFGSIAMFAYPLLYQLNQEWQWITVSQQAFGIYIGSSLHEVAQVVAAGRAVSQDAANTAVIAKMVRVMMLAPFLILLSIYLLRDKRAGEELSQPTERAFSGISFPWFTLGFMLVVALNSLAWLSAEVVNWLINFDGLLMAMAMAALGLTTHVSVIRQAGIKPLLLGALLFLWLMLGGALINLAVFSLWA